MNEKVLKTLEYDKILAMVSEHLASDIGREYLALVRPASTLDEAARLMQQTDEAYGFYRRNGRTPVESFPDIRETLRKAHAAYALSAGDLLSIARCLAASRSAREALSDDDGVDSLMLLANNLSAHRSIE